MPPYELAPPAELRNTIKCFWHFGLDLGAGPADFEVLPDGYAEIIFYFGGASGLATKVGRQLLPSPFVVGLLDGPVQFVGSGRFEVLGIKCFPWAVTELLGLPAGRGGVQVVLHSLAQLQAPLQALVQAGRIDEALAEAARYFLAIRPGAATADPLPYQAGAAMREANGTLPVREVAAATHATVRTLERRFKQAAGHTVKDVSALIRFEQVRDQLWDNPNASLAILAHALGYADQSHLGREFRRYSGTTPAAFARQVKQARQRAGRDFVAFVLT
ncbi:AraC family transcriptional regulator [Hymenobacter sp. RP-2-7]|uniref:AraC family transcriptional regulator n=1 Tax=Hymenobacter polaris TaxID=2682546 RepID=A0A7Y0FNP3_9BACT|nr:helix-turn-helix domain-containing protein [Hymenobacter polaris]NML66735.1 AraC family transcriptional regulator [Hymenobacter polaris]